MHWCEIFKTGIHKDSKGTERNWTNEDLETIKSNFEKYNPDVPICVGHPKSNSPAYGWIDTLKIEGEKLFASFKQVQDEFKQAVNKGLFKTRSISLTPDLKLRHLAFLGAQAPAIKGMEAFQFENNEDDILIEFQEERTNMEIQEQLDKAKDELKSGSQGGTKSQSDRALDFCETIDDRRSNFNCTGGKEQKQIELLQKENADLKAQILQQQQEAQSKDFEDFCDKAIEKGNILPAQKDSVINILSACSNTNFEFADDTGKTPVQEFKEFVSSLKQMDFEEIANKKKLQIDEAIDFSDSQTILEAIQKTQADYKSRGVEINPATALDIVKKGNN